MRRNSYRDWWILNENRKYFRGYSVEEGSWVVGSVESTEARRIFVEHVANRLPVILSEIIRKHVINRSIINTDFWKGYYKVEDELDFRH